MITISDASMADQTGRTVLRRWRGVQGFGGMFLAFSFFMPMVSTCNASLVPAEEFGTAASRCVEDPVEFAFAFVTMLSPYLFGAWAGFLGFRHRRIGALAEDRSGIPGAALFAIVLAILGTWGIVWLIELVRAPSLPDSMGEAMTLGWIGFSIGYFVICVRRGPGGLLCLRWYAGTCCFGWFCFVGIVLGIDGLARHGLWVSVLGTGLILLGCVMEASWVGAEPAWRTLRRLLNAEVRFHDIAGPRCRQCGYLLIGLTSGRCPECGTPAGSIEKPRGPWSRTVEAPASP